MNPIVAIAGLAVGTFFAISGYHKLFNAGRHATVLKTMQDLHIPFPGFNAWWVPLNEFFMGLALGFLSVSPVPVWLAKLPAVPLLVICTIALLSDGIKRIKGWSPIDFADWCDDVLYLPETLLCVLLAIVLIA